MSTLQLKRVCWPLAIFIALCSLVCVAYAGTSQSSAVFSTPILPASNYSNYNAFLKRSVAGAEERSAHDPHGRTLILKSLILAPLALVMFILFLILLIPIPVIANPTGRRSIQSSPYNNGIEMAKQILTADECVERVSCELSKISRAFEFTSWIPATLERLLARHKWSGKIVRGIQRTSEPTCNQFLCSPAKTLKRSLNM